MNYAGLLYDHSLHYLDHLAPFCALLNWPLIICEPDLADLARAYYPDLTVIEQPLIGLNPPPLIVSCETRPLLRAAFPHWKGKNLWLPHGNSDKGWKSAFFESALEKSDIALIYGQKMADFMKAKKIDPIQIRIGNFRAAYWEKHKSHYPLPLPEKNNFLYAPTWQDSEGNGSFWEAFPKLAENLPDNANLLVKLHPNTLRQHEIELDILKSRVQKSNILFLENIPPIYPLLAKSSAYIGDMSSIGYDFLYFDRPMYFLNMQKRDPATDQGLYLFRCGEEINPAQFSFPLSQDSSPNRKAVYSYTFDPIPKWEKLFKNLL